MKLYGKTLFLQASQTALLRWPGRGMFMLLSVLFGRQRTKNLYYCLAKAATAWLDNRDYQFNIFLNFHVMALYLYCTAGVVRKNARGPVGTGERKLTIAFCAPFSGMLSFGCHFFENMPDDVRVIIIDSEYCGHYASYLEQIVDEYHKFDDAVYSRLGSPVDILVNMDPKTDFQALALIPAQFRVFVSCGSILPPGGSSDVVMFPQPVPRYIVRAGKFVHRTTDVTLRGYTIFECTFPFDPRSKSLENLPWDQRLDLIIHHGSLYKLQEGFEIVLKLLACHPTYTFEIYGKGSEDIVERFYELAGKWGVRDRVVIHEPFQAIRDETGKIGGDGWFRFFERLTVAKLWIAPPYSIGGSARFEAMLAGVPTIVMTYGGNWATTPVYIKLPVLSVPENEVEDEDAYFAAMDRVLKDPFYAAKITAAQNERARNILDGHDFVDEILACHREFLKKRASQ